MRGAGFRRLGSIALAVATATAAGAQDVVGTATVDGQEVELLSDRTWRRVETEVDGCRLVDGPVTFCGDRGRWKQMETSNAGIDAAYSIDEGSFAMIAAGEIGRDRGADEGVFRAYILDTAAQDVGTDRPEELIVEETAAEVAGREAATIVLRTQAAGVPAVAVTTYLLMDDYGLEATTWRVGEGFTEEHRALHADLLSEIRIDPATE